MHNLRGAERGETLAADPAAANSAALWAGRNLAMANMIGEHDFELREWRLLDFLRRQTYGAERWVAYVARLDQFGEAVEVSRGNVSRILKRLKASLVIEERPELCYGFRFPVENWKVPRRLRLESLAEQLALFAPPEHLRDVLRESFGEEQGIPGRGPGTHTYAGRGDARPALQTGVPESGTPADLGGVFPNRERGRAGNRDGPERAVPESGTGHALMQCNNASNALSTEHSCIVTSPGVPESGTGGGRLDGERQRLMDELREAGAFGPDDHSLPCWLGMVRQRPAVVDWLLGEYRYAQTHRLILDAGAWMMSKWKWKGRPDR